MSIETTRPALLSDTTWRVIAYRDRNQQLVTMLEGAEVTAHFFPDGRLAGRAGCNNYRANYTTGDESQIHVGPIATTRMLCPEPAGVMEQEGAYLAALALATTYTVIARGLMMFADSGDLVVQCVLSAG
ncbi:MAG: META domain-containing protein [Anaerolineales bacterium]|nr:META domain-containing protein [Anaerolineales bacterium]